MLPHSEPKCASTGRRTGQKVELGHYHLAQGEVDRVAVPQRRVVGYCPRPREGWDGGTGVRGFGYGVRMTREE